MVDQSSSEEKVPLLQLGLLGWSDGFRRSGFFPDDLPSEWRLTYLSNELDCVAVPAEALHGLNSEMVEEWAEDTHDQFGFYLFLADCNPRQGEQRYRFRGLLQQLEPLGDQLVGILVGADCMASDIALLQRVLQGEGRQELPVCRLAELHSDGLSVEGVCSLQGGNGVALLHAKRELTPMAMRRVVELLKREGIDTLLFVPAEGLRANLQNVETISTLLG